MTAAAQTILHLAETATISVHPDELAASLRAEATAATAAAAQAGVNALVADALKRARLIEGLDVTTGFYQVWHTVRHRRIGPGAGGQARRSSL